MTELTIDASGEMKLDYEVVGQIIWAGPVSYLNVVGEWDQSGGTLCWGCGGVNAPREDFNEVEAERDKLGGERDDLLKKVEKLEEQVALLTKFDKARRPAGVEFNGYYAACIQAARARNAIDHIATALRGAKLYAYSDALRDVSVALDHAVSYPEPFLNRKHYPDLDGDFSKKHGGLVGAAS